VKQTEV